MIHPTESHYTKKSIQRIMLHKENVTTDHATFVYYALLL